MRTSRLTRRSAVDSAHPLPRPARALPCAIASTLATVIAFAASAQQPTAPPLPPATATAPVPPPPPTTSAQPPAAQPPEAQPPAAQPSPGQYPPGQYPPGQYPPGQYPQQAYPPGAAPGYPPGYDGTYGYPPAGYGPPVYGQPTYGAPYYPGYGPPVPTRVAPEKEKGYHLHDGFYLRMAVGVGHVSSKFTHDVSGEEATMGGAGASIDFAIGGAITPGFILAGRVIGINAYNPEYTDSTGSTTDNTELMLSSLQLAADIYPMPEGGLHFMAGVGPATLSWRHRYNYTSDYSSSFYNSSTTSDGIALAVGAGWEAWVGKDWSVGGMLNFCWAWMGDDEDSDTPIVSPGSGSTTADPKISRKAFAPSLMLTATFN